MKLNPNLRLTALAGSLVLLLSVLNACSGPETSSGPASDSIEGGVVNVYSTRHYDSDRALYDAFEAETGVTVRTREAGAAQLLETMVAEGENSPADVILAADAGTLWRFKQAGLTQPVRSQRINALIPPRLRGSEGHWVGLAKRHRVIAYDPQAVDGNTLDEMSDLADERFSGEICARSSTNIYNLSLLGEIIAREGRDAASEWAQAVKDNFARDPQGGDTAQIKAVAAGACSLAITNHYYWVRLAESGSEADRKAAGATRLAFVSAGDGVHTNITGAAIGAHAPHPDAARAFIEFLASPQGQSLLVVETREIPVIEGVDWPAGLERLPEYDESELDLGVLGENQAEAQRIFDRVGWK